jgi:hypothetical protein
MSQNAFSEGTYLSCTSQNPNTVGSIIGSADGTNLFLRLSSKELGVDVHGTNLRLVKHPELGGIFTGELPPQEPFVHLSLVLVPIKSPSMMGGNVRVSIMSYGSTVLELSCKD